VDIMKTPEEQAVDAANEAALAAARRHRAESAEKERIQKALDDALADSFPASDPVSIVTSQEEEAWREPPRQPEPRKP
jgi:hypothetical protein